MTATMAPITKSTHHCVATSPCPLSTGASRWDVALYAAMDAYVQHHRTCEKCARRLGLVPERACLWTEWYDPPQERLCGTGAALLLAWIRAAATHRPNKQDAA